jgi:hexosaminidase
MGDNIRTPLEGRAFKFVTPNGVSKTLEAAFLRYNALIFTRQSSDIIETRSFVSVVVENNSEDYPQLETDESYSLDIPHTRFTAMNPIVIEAKTIYGALRGLETLSQLVVFDFDTQEYIIMSTPISITDAPRFAHRGLLLDTSRHFQPVIFIKGVIDSLSYAKYNVLHWHVVDTQSFPFESSSYPKLWDGSYSKQERYTQSEIRDIVEYGRLRGVKVMIEFDMPGHAASWCAGYPEICPSKECQQPLNPASEQTFPLITSLLGECSGANSGNSKDGRNNGAALFPYNLLHLGGDEVSYTCWQLSSEIKAWEQQQGFTGAEDTYEYFVDKVASITRSQNRLPVQWVEVFEHFGSKLDNNTVVHVWKEKSTMDAVLTAGYRSLLSNNDLWYLDHLSTTWDDMYLNEPTEGLSATSDPSLILGGEACMWGETVDASDLENTVWPRAAAVAEVLWSPLNQLVRPASSSSKEGGSTVDLSTVEDRLESFRCLLTQRGVAAAPVTNIQARYAPKEPGSCYAQRRKL